MSGRFSKVEPSQPIEVVELYKTWPKDTFENKVSLGVAVYRTNEGLPWVLPAVREAEKILAADNNLDKEYFPVLGLETFTRSATKLLLGRENQALLENRVFGVQCLSGTGSLRVGAEFLHKHLKCDVFYCSKPTWQNHPVVFLSAGFEQAREYRYWCNATRSLDLQNLLDDLRSAPENAVVVLHACAHNPTGCDPTKDQWKQIADVMEDRKLIPFFDAAHQGFGNDLDEDAWSIRYFVSRGFELLCAQSFAKNFGLFNERIGNLIFVLKDQQYVPQVQSQVALIVRGMYSNPPSHGARIVDCILNNKNLFELWKENVATMSTRVTKMRRALRDELERLDTPGDWTHITSQIGMCCYTSLNERQSEHMVKHYHIYMLRSGRISMCGVTPFNVKYIGQAINETIRNVS